MRLVRFRLAQKELHHFGHAFVDSLLARADHAIEYFGSMLETGQRVWKVAELSFEGRLARLQKQPEVGELRLHFAGVSCDVKGRAAHAAEHELQECIVVVWEVSRWTPQENADVVVGLCGG